MLRLFVGPVFTASWVFSFPLAAAFSLSMEHSILHWIPGSPKSKCLFAGDAGHKAWQVWGSALQ